MDEIKTCAEGHTYNHLQCPACPICSKELLLKNSGEYFVTISVPAQRALLEAGIKSLGDLSKWSERELLKLHGFGPKSIKILKPLLKENGLAFKKR